MRIRPLRRRLRKKTEPAYEVIGLEEIAQGLDRLRRHEVTGHLVAGFGD